MHLFGVSRVFWDCKLSILYGKNTLTKWNSKETQFVEKTAQSLNIYKIYIQ
jgi:hypothetical protein